MLLATNTALILAQLRALFLNLTIVGDQELSAYIIPSWDPHHNVRVAECYQRRAFISNFDGGAGTAIVTESDALLFTDARYFVQAQQQLDENWMLMREGQPETPTQAEWIQRNIPPGSRIGVDATTYSKSEWTELSTALKSSNHTLVAVKQNLIDLIWTEKPACGRNEIKHLHIEFSGKNTSQKLDEIREQWRADVGIIVISELDEVAWLLNLRGSDLPLAPTFFSFAFILKDHLHLFVDADRLSEEIQNELIFQTGDKITYHNYADAVDQLALIANNTEGKVWLSKNCNFALANYVTPEERQLIQLTPLALMKAIKNPTEVEGMKKALIRDAASLCQFYAWLEEIMSLNLTVTEISAATKALEFRQEKENFVSLSFKTISASGAHGAIVHYFPTEDTDRPIFKDEMYLVDSGAHYLDGTTDITRTFHFGIPTSKQKEFYTRVLKGQIAIATLKFPSKTRGHVIDSFAREALWSVGLDYGHGTGHGVGSYLNVGEGPQSINKYNPDDPGFMENMFTSNEPGCYVENEFGIRLENVVRVVKANFSHSDFLAFEDLTFVPYQHNLIELELLTNTEISYLNKYQENCREIVGKFILDNELGSDGYNWLLRYTEPLPLHR